MPISSIRFKKEYRTLKEGLYITLYEGLNVLVGDNGTGKSSILNLLKEDGGAVLEIYPEESLCLYSLDMENKGLSGEALNYKVTSLCSSHGESNKNLLKLIENIKESIILIDEPDMALSIKGIKFLWEVLEEASQDNQIIISANNPYLISKVDMVYSLDHMSWVPSKEYLSILD